jgi:hypothetical protein
MITESLLIPIGLTQAVSAAGRLNVKVAMALLVTVLLGTGFVLHGQNGS